MRTRAWWLVVAVAVLSGCSDTAIGPGPIEFPGTFGLMGGVAGIPGSGIAPFVIPVPGAGLSYESSDSTPTTLYAVPNFVTTAGYFGEPDAIRSLASDMSGTVPSRLASPGNAANGGPGGSVSQAEMLSWTAKSLVGVALAVEAEQLWRGGGRGGYPVPGSGADPGASLTTTPEPGTMMLLGSGLVAIGTAAWLRKKRTFT